MTQEQLTAFLAHVKGNTNLQEQLKAAADVDTVAAIAKGAGFDFFSNDLKNAQSELSDEELEGAAGGADSDRVFCIGTKATSRMRCPDW